MTAAPRPAAGVRAPHERALAALDGAAERWRDADFPPRVRAVRAIEARLRYSEPVVDYALDRLFGGLTREALRAAIAAELGSLAALDGFAARPGRPDVAYVPLGLAAIVASDTTIGVAIPALAFALCAGCEVIVKDRGDALVAAFVATLAEEDPQVAAHVRVETWRGDDDAASAARLAGADVVVAYGGDAALAAIRSRLSPHARFVGHGHRTSVGYVPREALATPAGAGRHALAAARDALLYDGEGCLSLHALLVERGGAVAPEAFGRLLAHALDETAVEFPSAREPDPATVAFARSARFRASQGAGALYASLDGTHALALDPPRDEPPPLAPRALAAIAVDGADDALAWLRAQALPLEGFAMAGDPALARPDVAALALASGAARFCALGTLQDPPLAGDHGGSQRILPFVRAVYRA